METVGCIMCESPGDRVVVRENGFQAWRCHSCGVVFVSPRPSREDIAALYEADGAVVSCASLLRPALEKRLQASFTLRRILPYRAGGRLLEIGAGAGTFLTAARNAGFESAGMEANPILRDHLRSQGIECPEKLASTYDVIYGCDVLSHFFDPWSELAVIREHLGPRGLLVLETGNMGDVHPRFYPRIGRFQLPDHLYFFGERSLTRLLTRSGFTVLAVHRFSILPNLWLFRMKNRWRSVGEDHRAGLGVSRAPAAETPSRRLFGLVVHVLRYGLGSLLPKTGRPQTVLIIAEKAESPR